jgi:hypothetical protein
MGFAYAAKEKLHPMRTVIKALPQILKMFYAWIVCRNGKISQAACVIYQDLKYNNMDVLHSINLSIQHANIDKNQVSDGYHTFGELYKHRTELFILVCKMYCKLYPDNKDLVWKSEFHNDGTRIEGWFVMGLFINSGEQITYHLSMDMWKYTNFAKEVTTAYYDGHTSNDVAIRIHTLTQVL